MDFLPLPDLIRRPGLRIVIVQGMPSPWSQAARAIFEYKGLDYATGAYVPGVHHDELVDWSGQNSAPVVAHDDEPPIHRAMDILLLAERLAPKPALLPEDPEERIRVVGLSHEVMGDFGIGWWGRIAMFQPAVASGQAPEPVVRNAERWGYSEERAARAPREVATRIAVLAEQARASRARGSDFLVGDSLSALDLYWAAMSVLVAPLPEETMPTLPGYRGAFEIVGALPEVAEAMDPVLIEQRDTIVDRYYRTPFDYGP